MIVDKQCFKLEISCTRRNPAKMTLSPSRSKSPVGLRNLRIIYCTYTLFLCTRVEFAIKSVGVEIGCALAEMERI